MSINTSERSTSSLRRSTLLIGSPHRNMAELAAASLRAMGFREILKANDRTAINGILVSRKVSGIVLDLDLGPQVVVEIVRHTRREGGQNVNAPIVAITAGVTRKVLATVLAAGVNNVVMKPVSAQTLADALGAPHGRRKEIGAGTSPSVGGR